MTGHVLTLNAGSSSLKAALFARAGGDALARAEVERIGAAPRLSATGPAGRQSRDLAGGDGHPAALAAILGALAEAVPQMQVAAVAHRIVHGGPDRRESRRLDGAELAALDALSPFAPLHQPHNLAGVRAAMAAFPGALQIGCFDTAFHRAQPWVNDTYALPAEFYEQGVRRYGFHGLSYDYINGHLARTCPDLHSGRVVVAHLGNGASICAIANGRPVATTMGFSPADGLAMGTRCGQIDPGVLLYLMTEKAMDAAAITELLHRRSGLLGLSGLSGDMRRLEASDDPRAAEAIGYFTARIRRELAALAAAMEGLDGIVFTAGIGENSALVRALVCDGLGWLGVRIDAAANRAGRREITAPGCEIRTLVLPTDEECVLAREARRALDA